MQFDGFPCGYSCNAEAVNGDCLRHMAQLSRPQTDSPRPPPDRSWVEVDRRFKPWSDRQYAWLMTGLNLGLSIANLVMLARH